MRLTDEEADAVRILQTIPNQLAEFVPAQRPVPASGSPLALAFDRVGESSPKGNMLREIGSRVWVAVQITEETIDAMCRLLLPRWDAPLATAGLARSAMEIGGQASWLMEPVADDLRIARYLALAEN